VISEGSAPIGEGRLTPQDWEQRLVAHYLRTDGPLGGGPLRFIDATPAEIAIAASVDEEEAQQEFLAQFRAKDVEAWLSGTRVANSANLEVPGYFRYLVLTCLVSATETGAGATHNFRVRLGELLDMPDQMHRVSGVNELWRKLAAWSEHRRAAGHPIRKIELPSYGNMNLIGYAIRLAFPSWDDRRELTRILKTLDADVRQSPIRLVQELSRAVYSYRLPTGIDASFREFASLIAAGNRLLSGHRFWRLVQSIEQQLLRDDGSRSRPKWLLSGYFGGYEQDELHFRLSVDCPPQEEQVWEGSLSALEHQTGLPRALDLSLQRGILVLYEAPGALWTIGTNVASSGSAFTIIVAKQTSQLSRLRPLTSWRPLGGAWAVSDKLSTNELISLGDLLDIGIHREGTDDLQDISIDGGIRTDKRSWLGRPGFLPAITAPTRSQIALSSIDSANVLSATGHGGHWELQARAPLSGRWRIVAREENSEAEKVLTLESNAPERWKFPENSALEDEQEIIELAAPTDRSPPRQSPEPDELVDDTPNMLEAIYAAPHGYWSENELVPLITATLSKKSLVWDILRSYSEAGFLEAKLSRSWKARTWHLRQPRIVAADEHVSIVDGAVGAIALTRIRDAAVRLGANMVTRRLSVETLGPPVILIRGIRSIELAAALNMPCSERSFPKVPKAPTGWPIERRSDQGRLVAARWCFERGDFTPNLTEAYEREPRAGLERLIRQKRDDRDLYRVSGCGPSFLTSSRPTAILEAYRRIGRPLFRWSNGRLIRLAQSGYLPLPLASALRHRFLNHSGPVLLQDNQWQYHYPCDLATAMTLQRALGAAIEVDQEKEELVNRVANARRLGQRLSWYQASPSEHKA
jgi:hypothetical protein